MKKIHMLAAVLLLLISGTAMAQTKKSFTLDDLMWGGSNYWNLQPRNLYTAWWGDRLMETDTDEVKYLRDEKGRPAKGTAFTAEEVNAALDEPTQGKVRNLTYARFPYTGRPEVLLHTNKINLIYDWKQKKVVWTGPFALGAAAIDFNTASRSEAYVKDWNLYVTTADGKTHRVSVDGSRELVYGQSVHRDEFGIHK